MSTCWGPARCGPLVHRRPGALSPVLNGYVELACCRVFGLRNGGYDSGEGQRHTCGLTIPFIAGGHSSGAEDCCWDPRLWDPRLWDPLLWDPLEEREGAQAPAAALGLLRSLVLAAPRAGVEWVRSAQGEAPP